MYSLIYDIKDDAGTVIQKEKRTAKGIAKTAIDKQIRHLHYRQCLFQNKMTMNEMNLIRNQNHTLYVNNVRKVGLSNFCDKKFYKNSIHAYSFGHFMIPHIQKWCNVYVWIKIKSSFCLFFILFAIHLLCQNLVKKVSGSQFSSSSILGLLWSGSPDQFVLLRLFGWITGIGCGVGIGVAAGGSGTSGCICGCGLISYHKNRTLNIGK